MDFENKEIVDVQINEHVVPRDGSSVRSARSKIRRRPALFFDSAHDDPNNIHGIRRVTKEENHNENVDNNENEINLSNHEDIERNNIRNSIDKAIEDGLRELNDIISSQYDNDIDDDLLEKINEPTRLRLHKASESTECLLSMLFPTDYSKPNTLINIKQLLNHESQHLVLLIEIEQYKYILRELKVNDEIIWHIFYNISDLIYAQKSLVNYLESLTIEWDNEPFQFDEIMNLYSLLHVKCKDYVKNISTALSELKNLFDKNDKFKDAITTVTFDGKIMRLEELISKPINWLCNSLELIKSLIEAADYKCDRDKLEQTLKSLKDDSNDSRRSNKNALESSHFLRSNLFVEQQPNDQKKLRHLFLFSDMVVCAKQKLPKECDALYKHMITGHDDKCPASKSIERFEVKWYISLKSLVFHLSKHVENTERRKHDIAVLKDKIREIKLQLVTENNKLNANNFSFRKMMIKKDMDKFCSQMLKIQMDLLLISPNITLIISDGPDKPHTILIPSIKDLEIWKSEILKAQKDRQLNEYVSLSPSSVSNLVDGYRKHPAVIEAAIRPLLHEDGLSGVLNTTIHRVDGLNPDFRYSLSVEVDSFKLNELKARTKSSTGAASLTWDESFDIDLDCSQTMNILLYETKNYNESKEYLVGYFEFKINPKSIHNKTITETVPMLSNESVKLSIVVSFKFEVKNEFMKRQPSIMKAGLFGINLKSIITREKTKGLTVVENVPMIIVACFKIIEDRGLDEEGIYRISGSKNEINEVYKRLNKNAANAIQNLGSCDLHTITGIVKMYLRELPEPLMLTDNYPVLKNIAMLEDSSQSYKKYEQVIQQLPEPNHSTMIYVLKHFERVCAHSSRNQMIPGNLGLILGPTLMMPPCDPNEGFSNSNIARETINSMILAKVFTHIMHGICNGSIMLCPEKCEKL